MPHLLFFNLTSFQMTMDNPVKERNIGGVIFQVEANAFEQLRTYRRGLRGAEIGDEELNYWESQIAEVLLQHLNDDYPVVTIYDIEIAVNEVDFATLEFPRRELSFKKSESQARKEYIRRSVEQTPREYSPNRLVRNKSREMIGGVASGIANLLGIDELWVRLVWVAAALGISVFSYFSSSWFILGYLIMWMVLPGSYNLPDNEEIRRLLRHPEDKQLGGVASGIARYLNTDPSLVRLGMIISLLFNGASLGLYLLLWVIMPEAKSLEELRPADRPKFTFQDLEDKVKGWLNISRYRDEEPAWFRAVWGIPRWGAKLLDKKKDQDRLL